MWARQPREGALVLSPGSERDECAQGRLSSHAQGGGFAAAAGCARLASLAVLAGQHHNPDQEDQQLVAAIGNRPGQVAPPVASVKATADAAS